MDSLVQRLEQQVPKWTAGEIQEQPQHIPPSIRFVDFEQVLAVCRAWQAEQGKETGYWPTVGEVFYFGGRNVRVVGVERERKYPRVGIRSVDSNRLSYVGIGNWRAYAKPVPSPPRDRGVVGMAEPDVVVLAPDWTPPKGLDWRRALQDLGVRTIVHATTIEALPPAPAAREEER